MIGFEFILTAVISAVFGGLGIQLIHNLFATRLDLPDTDAKGSAGLGRSIPSFGKRPPIKLGYDEDGNLLNYDGEGHLLTVGHTRSGKGIGAIIPNLLTYEGSIFVIDPKGENVLASAAKRRAMGQSVHIIDPWNLTGLHNTNYDPGRSSRTSDDESIEKSRLIADAIVAPSDSPDQIFWENEARTLIATVVLHLIHSNSSKGILVALREILSESGKLVHLLEGLLLSPVANGVVARGAAQYLDKAPAEKSGVLSTARQQTEFLDVKALQGVLRQGDFKFSDLQNSPTTVYLVLPTWRLRTFGRWLRVMLAMALAEWSRNSNADRQPVLCIIDEFPSIGPLQAFDTAFALMAGFGVQLWPIIQDLSQLQKSYGSSWHTFAANAAVLQIFGTRDVLTAAYLSERLGVGTIYLNERSMTVGGEHNLTTASARIEQRPIYYADEIIRLDKDCGLVFVENADPVEFIKICYFNDPMFNELPHPEECSYIAAREFEGNSGV